VIDNRFARFNILASTYSAAGGAAPRLLILDGNFGAELIQLSARHGRGLPSDVIPMEVSALSGVSHAEMLAALACGFTHVDILLSPKAERDALDREMALATAVRADVRMLEVNDPNALSDALYGGPAGEVCAPILPMGNKRQVARLAAKALQPEAKLIALPDTAPYGAVVVDIDACTLCLSCVSLCPSGALGDNPDAPQLRFQEDACLQCGLCSTICPEDAITYAPQLNLTETALTQVVLHEEEPFPCIECGALFGVKSTVEKITEKLAGKHSMFANSDAAKMIQMCDNCRINAQFHSDDNPFQGGERPKPRTTADYFSDRKDH
jgi:ferredoxin